GDRGGDRLVEQREALEAVARLLPEGARPVLMGDRFHGSPELIAWCRRQGWGWRLRLKQDLLVFEAGGETTLAACFAQGARMLGGLQPTRKRVATNRPPGAQPRPPEPPVLPLAAGPP